MTDFVEVLQSHPDLLKAVTQDVRFNFLVNGVKTTQSTSLFGVTLVDSGGTTVSAGAVTELTTGEYAVQVAGSVISTETVLTATINVTTTGSLTHVFTHLYDVVGSQLFTIWELRTTNASKFTAAKFPDEEVTRARALITEFFEAYCNTSFVRRYRDITVDGPGVTEVNLPVNNLQSVIRGTDDGTALTTAEITDLDIYPYGLINNDNGWSSARQGLVLGVVAGFTKPPLDIRRAALIYARHVLSPGNVTDRAMIFTDETGTWRLAQAGKGDRPTGFPEVDFVLNQYREVGIW